MLALEEGRRLTRLIGNSEVAVQADGWPMVCRSGFRSRARQTRKGFENAMILTDGSYRKRRKKCDVG